MTFGLELSLALMVHKPLGLDWIYIIGSPSSPDGHLQLLGLVSIHYHVSQFLIINRFLYICICIYMYICLYVCFYVYMLLVVSLKDSD